MARQIEKIINEEHILRIYDKNKKTKAKINNKIFNNIKLYTSLYSGFGKTTEIKYEVKNNKGLYYYLPIGGSFTRDYIIQNLKNTNFALKSGNNSYLHLDLSEADNEELMSEILFKLIVLRYVDSESNIFYLGNEARIIVELPRGFIDFEKKYKIFNLFENKVCIEKLRTLRLEENAKYIKDSPISIVAEVLNYYEKNKIGKENINLNKKI